MNCRLDQDLLTRGRGNQGLQLSHGSTDGHRLSAFDKLAAHDAVMKNLYLDSALLGLHHGDYVPLGKDLAGLEDPCDESAGLHIGTEGGHTVESSHGRG